MQMDRCHFWLARFRDEHAVEQYFAEPDEYVEGEPISQFARDQHKRFYDHDFVFAEFDPNGQLELLCHRIRLPAETRRKLLSTREEGYNAIIGADEGEFFTPLSVDGDPRLSYIGCFPCWPHET